MDAGRHCTLKVRAVNADDMKDAPIVVSSPDLLTLIINYKPYDIMDGLGRSTLRPSHVFICVEVILDGKRMGGQGAYMNLECDSTCKQVLLAFLNTHSTDNCPLPDSSKVIMQCTKLSDDVQGRAAADVGVVRDCSVF